MPSRIPTRIRTRLCRAARRRRRAMRQASRPAPTQVRRTTGRSHVKEHQENTPEMGLRYIGHKLPPADEEAVRHAGYRSPEGPPQIVDCGNLGLPGERETRQV